MSTDYRALCAELTKALDAELDLFETRHSELLERAAQWGADQELEACKQFMHDQDWLAIGMSPTLRMNELHNARRPQPPSLKEQALALLDKAEDSSWDINDFSIVRRALEALPE
jgi:hypothetical protein